MKRLTIIVCSLLVLFAGTSRAWGSCDKLAFLYGEHQSSGSAHGHDHHSNHTDHDHPANLAIHCPTVDEFVSTPTVSLRDRGENLNELIWSAVSLFPQQENSGFSDSTTHGPPLPIGSSVPVRLLFSVFRI
jgi:hypothetical protein